MADTQAQQGGFDSDRQQVGEVYAQALLAAASTGGVVEVALEQLESLCLDVLGELPKLKLLLESPRISPTEKERVIDQAFAGRMDRTLLNFLKVLANHGRLDCLDAIAVAFRNLSNEAEGRIQLELTSATPLDEASQESIARKLGEKLNKTVEIQLAVDPDLIGGTVIRAGDTVYDGSVANQLEKLRQETLHKTTQQFQDTADRFTSEENS